MVLWIFAVACGLLAAARVQDLVAQPGIEPGPPALGAWTTKEVPIADFKCNEKPLKGFILFLFIYLFLINLFF